MGERLQERRKINKNISWKGGMMPEQCFFRFPQCCTKFETRNLKIAETPKMIEKVETGTINRERRKTMIAILEVEVATNITHINLQQKSPLKMTKKLAYSS